MGILLPDMGNEGDDPGAYGSRLVLFTGSARELTLVKQPNENTMKTYSFLPIICLIGGSMFATSCMQPGDATEKTNDQMQENKTEMNDAKMESSEAWRDERTEAVKELRDLRETLADRQMSEQKKLNDGIKDASKKAECQAMVTELGTNIARIDASLAKMEASTGTDWSNMKMEARKTADDTKTWWDRQKEMIDKKTDADKDHDGH